jgi:hypothetical protein
MRTEVALETSVEPLERSQPHQEREGDVSAYIFVSFSFLFVLLNIVVAGRVSRFTRPDAERESPLRASTINGVVDTAIDWRFTWVMWHDDIDDGGTNVASSVGNTKGDRVYTSVASTISFGSQLN